MSDEGFLIHEAYARGFHNSAGSAMVDRTNTPSPVRDRKFSITSALSIAAQTEGATPNNRVA